jgi:hypothetical protein
VKLDDRASTLDTARPLRLSTNPFCDLQRRDKNKAKSYLVFAYTAGNISALIFSSLSCLVTAFCPFSHLHDIEGVPDFINARHQAGGFDHDVLYLVGG